MKHLKISIISTIVIYLMVSFIKFDLTWLREIPDYDDGVRGLILIILVAQEVYIWIFIRK